MFKRIAALAFILLLSVPALAEGYTAADAPVFRETLAGETVTLRFYDDLPSVPCLGLAAYYRLVLGEEMSVENRGDGTYAFVTPGGATAIVDVNAGTLTCADFPAFTNLMGLVDPGMDNQYLDFPTFARPAGLVCDAPEPVTLDFAKYRIPLHGEMEDVWMPLATLSDVFTNLANIYVSWNGEKVYVNHDYTIDTAWERDPDFAAPIFGRPDRAPDMAAFAYDELCFAVDNFYGHPGSAEIEDDLTQYGLDGALQRHSDYSRRCRDLLRSEKLGEYVLGSEFLYTLLYDGGHTGLNFSEILDDKDAYPDFTTDYYMASQEGEPDIVPLKASREEKRVQNLLRQKRRDALGNGHYAEKGDTALIWFDSFMYDFDGWLDYYAGGPRPQDDQMARVIDGLNRASANPAIKNVVLDVSCNFGGSGEMVATIMSLIADQPAFYGENLLIGRKVAHTYRVDRNFDGVFDERDDAVRYDFNFGILTSRLSFSCANLLPALMKISGMAVLGERSGGGACGVAQHATPDGFTYQLSSALIRFVDADGKPVDDGVPLDIPLAEGGDYSRLYDLDAISAGMNAYYGTAARAA